MSYRDQIRDDSIQALKDQLDMVERINAAKTFLNGTAYEVTSRKVTGPIVITKIQQICFGCPSSWAAWDENGKEYTLRYRYGVGVLRRIDRGEMIAKFKHGDDMAGICTLEEFVERIGGYIVLSEDLQHLAEGESYEDTRVSNQVLNIALDPTKGNPRTSW